MSLLVDPADSPAEPEIVDVDSSDLPKPLLSHLDDLRVCIIRAFTGWIAGVGIVYALFPRLLPLLIRPPVDKLVFTSPMEPFITQVKLSMIGGFVATFPWILLQTWRFVAPGLKPTERKALRGLIVPSYLLFLTGGSIGLFVAAPVGLRFLLSYKTDYLIPYITLSAYLGYLSYLMLGLGFLFQLPIVLYIVVAIGLVRRETLSRYRRHVFLGLLIVAACISPSPDISGQLLVAIPAYLLYELSILVLWLTRRNT